jgi:DNA primase
MQNVVGTLGTAFGEEHVKSLRRLTDRVVLLFDGDEAGQSAAEKALVIFLSHDLDVQILSLPDRLDPAEFVDAHGVEALQDLVARAVDPLNFVIARAAARFNLKSVDGARQASQWVLTILARIPQSQAIGVDLKVAKALDTLGSRLGGISVSILERDLRQLRDRTRRASARAATPAEPANGEAQAVTHIRPSDLDRIDRELVEIVLNEPAAVSELYTRVLVSSLRDAPLRAILKASYDIHEEGEIPTFERVLNRLEDPAIRSLAAGLQLPIDPLPLPASMAPAPIGVRLAALLPTIDLRLRQERIRDLKSALAEVDRESNPEEYEALRLEYLRLCNQRPPDTRKKN